MASDDQPGGSAEATRVELPDGGGSVANQLRLVEASRARYVEFFEEAPVGLMVIRSRDGRGLAVNRSALALLGFGSRAEWQRSFALGSACADEREFRQLLTELRATQRASRTLCTTRDDIDPIWLKVEARLVPDRAEIECVLRDVSDSAPRADVRAALASSTTAAVRQTANTAFTYALAHLDFARRELEDDAPNSLDDVRHVVVDARAKLQAGRREVTLIAGLFGQPRLYSFDEWLRGIQLLAQQSAGAAQIDVGITGPADVRVAPTPELTEVLAVLIAHAARQPATTCPLTVNIEPQAAEHAISLEGDAGAAPWASIPPRLALALVHQTKAAGARLELRPRRAVFIVPAPAPPSTTPGELTGVA